ncbi:MAG: hypothetical protein ACREOB_03915 [Thermodesulfobacteriota bacterium]
MSCLACGRKFHEECDLGCESCHPTPEPVIVEKRSVGRPLSDPKTMKDPKSTGRKRAALLYPIDKTLDCEWKGKKNCGGGTFPIIGCSEGNQIDRHHGPIKDPTRNEMGNVHRICKPCHNHWHELNDLVYKEEEFSKTKHEPVAASKQEIAVNAILWKNGEMGRRHTLASSIKKPRIAND